MQTFVFHVQLSINQKQRLDQILTEYCTKNNIVLSRSQIQKIIDSGLVQINNQPINLNIEILYEDEDLAFINKPAGLSMHPSETENSPTMVHGLLYQLKSLSSIGGVERPGIVHRIDKGTSGVVVVSKNDFSHLELSKQFKEHSIVRIYEALVYGDLSERGLSGRIETLIGRNPKNRKTMTSKVKQGRKAITNWKCIKIFKLKKNISFSLVECRLETGRTHQIRVHLSEMGYDIVGDQNYGKKRMHYFDEIKKNCPLLFEHLKNLDHQLLHAKTLGLIHPKTKNYIELSSKRPSDFEAILQALETYLAI